MGFEVDFLAIGEESKSGDAIVLRYGNLQGTRAQQAVIVIDGGFAEDGQKVVDFVKARYGTDYADVVISTHPDNDHIGGLPTVLRGLRVGALWMHRPWLHSTTINMAKAAHFGALNLAEDVRKSLEGASELDAIASANGIPIQEPFTGLADPLGGFVVVGPSQQFYEQQLAEIKPEAALTLSKMLAEIARRAAEVAGNLVPETLLLETLTNLGDTSPANESSVISLMQYDGRRVLFTSDAGMKALGEAAAILARAGIPAGGYSLFQMPHHGSKQNVGPTVLDQLLGPKGSTANSGSAFASSAKDGSPKHPAKKVTNAMIRRGYRPFVTRGTNLWHRFNAPVRADYGDATPIEFFNQVEESDE